MTFLPDMAVNPYKIDISKEMEMLDKHYRAKKKEREERDKYIRRGFIDFLEKEYSKED